MTPAGAYTCNTEEKKITPDEMLRMAKTNGAMLKRVIDIEIGHKDKRPIAAMRFYGGV